MAAAAARLNAFPVFMKVEKRIVVIVGSGGEALAKTRLIGQSSAAIRIVAETPEAELAAFAAEIGAELVGKPYSADLVEGACLVFAATGDEALDGRVVVDAKARGIPVNAVDRPHLCDFFTPALVNRAPVVVAIGTEGAGPVLAQMIRARVDRMLSPALGPLASLAASLRETVERLVP